MECGTNGQAGEEALSAARFRFTTIAHEGRDILGPMSLATVDAMIARLPVRDQGLGVFDIGCGKGTILVRTLVRTGGRGVGVEPNPAFAADARDRALQLGPDRVRIVEYAYETSLLESHSFDLGICTGALHAFGDWAATLAGMSNIVAPGGYALLGPGYWKQPPPRAYLAQIDGTEDEQDSLPQTLSAAVSAGWEVLACHESTLEEWDDYEHTYAASMRRWCDENPGDRDAKPYRERIENWADAYAKWGRDTMGFALVLMRRK